MAQANCSDVACLRSAPTETLMDANSLLTQNSISSGSVGFVVVVDGEYVPDLPGKLFLEGRYHKNLTSVITANNQYEVHCLPAFFWVLVTDREKILRDASSSPRRTT